MSIYRKGRFYHYDFMVAGVRYAGSTKRETSEQAQIVEHSLRDQVANPDQPRPQPDRRDGFVYFVQGQITRLIKIGYAVDVPVRFATLCTCSPDALTLLCDTKGTQRQEAWAHRLLAEHHAHGEWFRPEPPVLEFVKLAEQSGMEEAIKFAIEGRQRAAA